MFGLIDTKVYAAISVITAGLLYAIDFFDKNEVVKNWLLAQASLASGSGLGRSLSGLIVRPIIYAIDGPIGAVLAGIMWPVTILWILLLLLLLSFAFIAPGFFKARCATSITC